MKAWDNDREPRVLAGIYVCRRPHFSLEGHDKGVNCIDYYPGGDKVRRAGREGGTPR